jgi:hypothetical protein
VKGERELSMFYSRHRAAKRISSYVQQNHIYGVTKLMDGDFHIWCLRTAQEGGIKGRSNVPSHRDLIFVTW